MGLLPDPRSLIAAADFGFQQPEGITPPRHELEDFLHVARNPNPLYHHIGDVRMRIEPTSRDAHHHVRNLPSAVPVVGYLDEDGRITCRSRKMFLSGWVSPALEALTPDLT
jgi:hypothetical protein